jgi:hypothetical protein
MILGDYGESRLNNELEVVFTRHTRVKIFTPAGFDWGTRVLTLYTKDHEETLSDLEGATYTLDANGEVERTKLDRSAIFEESVDEEHTRYRFAFPALKPGCVIEYRYTITQQSWFFFPSWTFQSSIPVRWSEYRAIEPRGLAYARATKGYEAFAVNEATEVLWHFTGSAAVYLGESIAKCTQYRWVMRDLPALKEEPFITTMDDYASSVELQLAEYALRGGGSKRVLKSWDALISELLKSGHLGGMTETIGPVRELAQKVIAGKETPFDRMTAIYDYIRTTLVWNHQYRVFGNGDLGEVLESKKGTSAEVNLLLISMLRSAGIGADPVLISTRSNGRITELYPLVSQFNTIVARAVVGGTQYFLDATDPLRGRDLLPTGALNVRGLVIQEGKVEWVTLTSNRKYVHRSLADLTLDSTGGARGTLASVDEDYAAFLRRRDLVEKKSLDIARETFETEKTGFSIDSLTVLGRDSIAGPLTITAVVSSPAVAQTSGEYLYCNASILDRVNNNPFKLKVRRFPVDMAYARSFTRSTVIHIPEGYEVKELPRTVDLTSGLDEARFTRSASAENNTVQVLVRMSITATTFQPSRYESLKGFYDQIVAAEADQIVLRRIPLVRPQGAPKTVKPSKGGKTR